MALAFAVSPLSALAVENVNTGFIRSTAGGEAPIIKVKWEHYQGTQGRDQLSDAGSQLMPTGQFQNDTEVTFCAVATDPDGVADIDAVYADVFYPATVSFHNGASGCGEQVGDEIALSRLSKEAGWTLLCNSIRNGNNSLPVWAEGYDYDEVCAEDGELMKETAYVYCGDRSLSYEDPDGTYIVKVHAADKAGLNSSRLTNELEYLQVTAFEVDFTSVNYGTVKLNTHKITNGDLTFGTSDRPTVRNTGNTRLDMEVYQNDMGLGTTNGQPNVMWDGRVGSTASWTVYPPFDWTTLDDTLELSETDEMDFSIQVSKFPPEFDGRTSFSGAMSLNGLFVEHASCIQE